MDEKLQLMHFLIRVSLELDGFSIKYLIDLFQGKHISISVAILLISQKSFLTPCSWSLSGEMLMQSHKSE